MRCAKVTKSETIYPMCCNNDDGVKDWCNEYVYFGRDESLQKLMDDLVGPGDGDLGNLTTYFPKSIKIPCTQLLLWIDWL